MSHTDGDENKARLQDSREIDRPQLAARAVQPLPRPRRVGLILGIACALILLLLIDIGSGESSVAAVVPPRDVVQVIAHHIPLLSTRLGALTDALHPADIIVWQIRVPRAIGGALVGMLLALAGVAFQSLLMNPLADPYTVGVSSGAALGSMLAIITGATGLLGGLGQPIVAFGAGLLTMVLVYYMARVGGRISAQSFLLAGLTIGTFLWSLIPLMLSIARGGGNLDRQSVILGELLGHLGNLDWRSVGILLAFGATGGAVLAAATTELDIMTLGEESAAHLGVNTESFKRRVIVAGSLVTAATVAMAGIIAFVGLIVPHIARRMVGPRHAVLLPTAVLLGGLLLVVSDLLSRVLLNQLEIGVITSLIGAPLFCYLLRNRLKTSA